MGTKITYIGSKPSTTSGSDVTGYGPHTPATIDQNFANLQSNLDKLGGFTASQTPGANQIPVLDATDSLALTRGKISSSGPFASSTLNISAANPIYIGTTNSNFLGFVVNNSEAGRFDASGNLLVGVTSGTHTTITKAHSGDRVLSVVNTGTANPYGLLVNMTGVNGTAIALFEGADQGGTRFLVAGSGNVQNVNNSYGAISDLRLKENISAARGYLSDLCGVRVVKYSLIADESPAATHLGVIAQELEQIFPGMVEETPDVGERQVEIDGVPQVDGEGNPITERYDLGTTTKSVKYSVFVPMLITAVQELKTDNDELRAENTELRAQIIDLLLRVAALESK